MTHDEVGERSDPSPCEGRAAAFVDRNLTLASQTLSGGAVAAMAAIIIYEVVSRYVFGAPTAWATEYSSYALLAVVFFGGSAVYLLNRNINVSAFVDILPAGTSRTLRKVGDLLILAALVILYWKFLAFVNSEFRSGTRDWGMMGTLLWMPQTLIVAGYFLMILAAVTRMARDSKIQGSLQFTALIVIYLLLAAILTLDSLRYWSIPFREDLVILFILAVIASSALLVLGKNETLIFIAVSLLTALSFWVSTDVSLSIKVLVFILITLMLLGLGFDIAISLVVLGILGGLFWLPFPSVQPIAERAWGTVNTFTLTAIPMFVLMGALMVKSGVSSQMFRALKVIGGRAPGSLAHASVGASGVFAAVSGSSLATAATIGQVAGPEMIANGYDRRLAYGVLAAGGTLGILIPPSIAMLLYGSVVGVSTTDLFIAGIIPGLMLMGLFSTVVLIWIAIDKQAAPRARAYTGKEKLRSLGAALPFVLLIVIIISSLYLGIATPTEAGAVGAVGALGICIAKGKASWKLIGEALNEAAIVSSFLLLIAVGAAQMGYILDYLGAPTAMIQAVQALDMPVWAVMLGIVAVYVVLGMFIDPISMMLMTLPVVAPLVHGMGLELLWFGVFLVILIEVALVTPPVGMLLFVLKGVAEEKTTVQHIVIGVLPFLFIIFFSLFLIYLFPGIVTWLPSIN